MATQKSKRNRNAGKSTGKSESAKYFAKNPKARAKKNAYNKKISFNQSPQEIQSRTKQA